MRLVFDDVDAYFECKKCNSPVYISSIGAEGYTMHTIEKYASQKCSTCKEKLSIVMITGDLRRMGRNVYV